MDAIPLLSQVKSVVQWASGDSEGARKTQENFLKLCPVVSQGTSVVQALSGDLEGARETQLQFAMGVSSMADSVPVVGHVKGAIHYACGDQEGGDSAMKAASHSSAVVAGGVGGFLVAGPAGAALAGAAAGTLMDDIITVVDSAVHDEFKPYGLVGNIGRIVDNPKDGGAYVDLVGGVALDAVGGYAAGEGLGRKIEYKIEKGRLGNKIGRQAAREVTDLSEKMNEIHRSRDLGRKPHVMTQVTDAQTGETYVGHNRQVRKVVAPDQARLTRPTQLQRRVPDAQQPLGRSPQACAEHHAYQQLYDENPGVPAGRTRAVSVRMDKALNRPVAVARCDNCVRYCEAMGAVPTDLIDGAVIPARVRACKVAGCVLGGGAVLGMRQAHCD